MPTPFQGGFALVALAALAIAVSAFDGDDRGALAAEPPAAARTANAAGAGSDAQALTPTTSAPIANPFSTFMQAPPRDAASTTPSNEPLPFAFAGTRVEGGQTVVILSQQGRSIAVHDTGMLNDSYEVEAIDERQVVILHLPSMTRQVLAIGPTRAFVAAPAALAPADEAEPEN